MRNKYCILILLTVLSLSWKQKNNMKSNERIVYALDVTIPGRYEAYINDIWWCFKKYDTTLDVPIIDIKES